MEINRRTVLKGIGAAAAIMVAPPFRGYTVRLTGGNTLVNPETVAREALQHLRNNLIMGRLNNLQIGKPVAVSHELSLSIEEYNERYIEPHRAG